MDKLRIGVVGTGNIFSSRHCPAWAKMEKEGRVQVVALCDIVPGRADKYTQYFENARTYVDYKEMLEKEQLDAVDICTPNFLHSIIAVDALNSGRHVFCEKPDAVSVAEAQKMKDAAERSGKMLMVMRNNRYLGVASFLKQYILDGNMGEIYAARCGWQRRRGIPGKGGWFTTKAKSGGGPLIDLGVHMIDLSMWLMGSPRPVAVTGCTYTKFADSDVSDSTESRFGEKDAQGTFDVEDLAMGFIRFENGACMQIEFSWASNIDKERRFFELRGTKSGAKWDNVSDQLGIYTEAYGQTADYLPRIQCNEEHIHEANLIHFVDVLEGKAQPMFVPQQGLDMVKILEAMYKSAAEGHEVIL